MNCVQYNCTNDIINMTSICLFQELSKRDQEKDGEITTSITTLRSLIHF